MVGGRGLGSPVPCTGTGTSQRCMGSMSAGPAASASELPRKPRRASIRSLRENSLSRATVCGPAHGRSTPATEGDWWAVRSPSCSTATTAPKRSENSSERMRGIGSRGCSPSSQRRTREVSVLMWESAHLPGPPVDLACQLALGPATAHEPRAQLLVGTLARIRVACAAATHWNAPIPLKPHRANHYQNAVHRCCPYGSWMPSNRKSGCLGHTRGCTYSQSSCTDGNPTITPLARGIEETPPFATPSNEPDCRCARLT